MVTTSLQMIFNGPPYEKVFTKQIEYMQTYTIHDLTYMLIFTLIKWLQTTHIGSANPVDFVYKKRLLP